MVRINRSGGERGGALVHRAVEEDLVVDLVGQQTQLRLLRPVVCALCERRMIGNFNNGHNHYRCTYSSEDADANDSPTRAASTSARTRVS